MHGLSADKVASLFAVGRDPEIAFRVTVRGIFAESDRYLDSLMLLAREGKHVETVSIFCRWLRFSGVLTLRKFLPDEVLPDLERKLADLLQECAPYLQGGRVVPSVPLSELEALNAKLDAVLAAVARPVSLTAKAGLSGPRSQSDPAVFAADSRTVPGILPVPAADSTAIYDNP
jgi:hypothetical protein